MKTTIKLFLLVLMIVSISACRLLEEKRNTTDKNPLLFQIDAGINKGGIVENNDMTVLPATQPDAYTGATNTGFHTGGHVLIPLKHNYLQAGIIYMFNSQSFSYNDSVNQYFGKRNIYLSQIMLPITYNISVFRKKYPTGLFQIKFGYVEQYNMALCNSSENGLPEYKIRPWSGGVTFGIQTRPFALTEKAKIGFYLSVYRGGMIYEDFYNRSSFEVPGSSYFSFGLLTHF